MKKRIREKGSIPPLSRILIDYRIGDKVYIGVDPAIHNGMPHRRYIGKVGTVVGFRGRALEVEVKVGTKIKKLFLFPEHLKPAFDVNNRIKEILIKLKELKNLRKLHREQILSLLQKQSV